MKNILLLILHRVWVDIWKMEELNFFKMLISLKSSNIQTAEMKSIEIFQILSLILCLTPSFQILT